MLFRSQGIQGVDLTQNTQIQGIQGVDLAQNSAISIIQGTDATQNVQIGGIQGVDLAQNASITIIQGVDNTQNVQIAGIQGVDLAQNASITIIQGVDNTQNTWISSNNALQSGINATQNTQIQNAYNTANVGYNFVNTGGTVSGNVSIQGNLAVTGNISVTGNVINQTITGNTGQFFGYAANGFNALYAGIPTGFKFEPQTVFQSTGNINDYAQINIQNINPNGNASGDYVVTADNGSANDTFIDMGDRKSTRLNSSHIPLSRMPSSA